MRVPVTRPAWLDGRVPFVFGGLGLVPPRSSAHLPDQGISWDYTTWLNIVGLILAACW